MKITQTFYKVLSKSHTNTEVDWQEYKTKLTHVGPEEIPEVTRGEVSYILQAMKNQKLSGKDGITIELLK